MRKPDFFEPAPEGLATTIEYALTHLEQFSPREYIMKNTGKNNSFKKLKDALRILCEKDNIKYRFDDIDWDGRNQSFIWGKKVFETLKKYCKKK